MDLKNQVTRSTSRRNISLASSAGTRRSRLALGLAAILAAAVLGTAGAVVPVSPAQASSTLAFNIFYSSNCTGAWRWYPGPNSGEAWINDTFNSGSGLGGYGSLIRNNAASIQLAPNTLVLISSNGGSTWKPYASGASSTCINLSSQGQANQNTNWKTMAP